MDKSPGASWHTHTNHRIATGGLAGIPPLWAAGQPLRAAGGRPRSTPPDVGHAPRDRGPVQAGGLQQVPDLAVVLLFGLPRVLQLHAGGGDEIRRGLSGCWIVHGFGFEMSTSTTCRVKGSRALRDLHWQNTTPIPAGMELDFRVSRAGFGQPQLAPQCRGRLPGPQTRAGQRQRGGYYPIQEIL